VSVLGAADWLAVNGYTQVRIACLL